MDQEPPVPQTPDPFAAYREQQQQPPQPPPTPDPFSAYQQPVPPQKKSKTWLYILLGVVGLCVVCGVIGLVGWNMLRPQVDEVMNQVQSTLEVQMQSTQAVQNVPNGQNVNQDFIGGNPYISQVTMASGVSGEMYDPVNPTTVFTSSDTFHAVVAIQDAPEGTVFRADWYAVDVGDAAAPNTFIDGNELTAGDTRNLDFSLTPNTGWPTGTYRVEIRVNGTLDRVHFFSVQ
ncbi:MAG TPA: hypothetical protein VIO36_12885 [Anaerolineaceae bacterium]